jgi:UDP-glucose 4-epimerase
MLYNLFENRDFVSVFAVALLAEGVDRNLLRYFNPIGAHVALLAEGVDRNLYEGK